MTKKTGRAGRKINGVAVLCGAALALALVPASPLVAQIGGLPGPVGAVGGQLGDTLGGIGGDVLDPLGRSLEQTGRSLRRTVRRLAHLREERLESFVKETPGVEWDEEGNPARAGEVLVLDPDAAALEVARAQGFAVLEQAQLDGLEVAYARLAVPDGRTLPRALEGLRKALPQYAISADTIHFPSGHVVAKAAAAAQAPPPAMPRGGTVGLIDGGVGGSDRLAAQKGFATGAPRVGAHGSAIASLLAGAGTAKIYAADVYGDDPAGGDALAIARALAWMQARQVPVVSISLVGPSNPLLARAIASVRAKGMQVVAAVGNDGPAAPPAYPASYPGVVAVTGVDGRGRVLIEAGRATHLDYAAPGADLTARVPGKGRIDLRGTSFAAPLAASRLAARRVGGQGAGAALKAVDGEALDGAKATGRGVVCNICRAGL